jgi:hypothetical protein
MSHSLKPMQHHSSTPSERNKTGLTFLSPHQAALPSHLPYSHPGNLHSRYPPGGSYVSFTCPSGSLFQSCFNLSPEDPPALREVVAGIGAGDLKQCILPWGQLDHISLGAFSNNVSDHLEVLSRCFRAEKCVFEPPAWAIRDELPPAVDNTLSSPLLIRSFCIQFPRFTSRATALIDRLSTPELEELSLSSISLDVVSDVGAIQSAERLIHAVRCVTLPHFNSASTI